MTTHIIQRTTETETQELVCKNMRAANILFDQVKDHVTTTHTQLLAYGKVVRSHTSNKSVSTPLSTNLYNKL